LWLYRYHNLSYFSIISAFPPNLRGRFFACLLYRGCLFRQQLICCLQLDFNYNRNPTSSENMHPCKHDDIIDLYASQLSKRVVEGMKIATANPRRKFLYDPLFWKWSWNHSTLIFSLMEVQSIWQIGLILYSKALIKCAPNTKLIEGFFFQMVRKASNLCHKFDAFLTIW